MRRIALRLGAFALLTTLSAAAAAADYSPRSGDRELDLQLLSINALASSARDAAIDELVATYGAPRYLVTEMLGERQWAPADVFFACALAYRVRRPCAELAGDYEKLAERALGTLARSSGLRPGSASFVALKAQLAKSRARLQAMAPAPEAGDTGTMPEDDPAK